VLRTDLAYYTYFSSNFIVWFLCYTELCEIKLYIIVQVVVLWSEQEIQCAIREIHEGCGESIESKSMRSHHGITSTMNLISSQFYWRRIDLDIREYIKSCEQCQKVYPKLSAEAPELQSVAVPKEVMRQIGIDISCLPESNGFKYIVVAIDYFTKWSEAKALTDKLPVSVTRFLFELICRHGCIRAT